MRVSGSARYRAGSCRRSPSPPEFDLDTGALPADEPSVDPSQYRSPSDLTCSRTAPPLAIQLPATRSLQSPADWSAEKTPWPLRPDRRSPSDLRERPSYSMYPNPRSRFCISSFDVLLSSGRIFLVSFSSKWI